MNARIPPTITTTATTPMISPGETCTGPFAFSRCALAAAAALGLNAVTPGLLGMYGAAGGGAAPPPPPPPAPTTNVDLHCGHVARRPIHSSLTFSALPQL